MAPKQAAHVPNATTPLWPVRPWMVMTMAMMIAIKVTMTLMIAMVVTTTMRIAIEVAMTLMIAMVVRMTMMIAIKVAMTLRQGQPWELNRLWQTSQNHPMFAFPRSHYENLSLKITLKILLP